MATANGHANEQTHRSSSPVALITGGVSGMGLAVVESLLKQNWNVTVLDLNADLGAKLVSQHKDIGDRINFVQTNVTSYDAQAAAFVDTWRRWGRLDFVHANAGLADKMDFHRPVPASECRPDGAPPKPDELVLDVCLNAMVYTAYLALHYFRKNADGKGKLVFTASMAGLYPGLGIPLYATAKHGIVGLTRSLAAKISANEEKITVNCLCPGLVPTGLTAPIMAICPPEYITPPSTVVRAVQQFLDDDTLTGQVAECSGEAIHHRKQPEYGDEKAEFIMGEGFRNIMKSMKVRIEEDPSQKASGGAWVRGQ